MQNKPYWIGHRQRLRERAESVGWDALRPHEMIELILFYAVPRQDMTEPARNLISAFGSVEGVLYADREKLLEVPGVTRRMADWLQVTREMIDAYVPFGNDDKKQMFRYRDVLEYLMPLWRAVRPPECWMIYTDFDDRVITHTVMCDSLGWNTRQCVRDTVREAVAADARHAVLVMFVGAQPLEASQEDVDAVILFARTLHAVEVELLDCVLVNESGFYSMNLHGQLEKYAEESGQMALHERYTRDDIADTLEET